MAEAVLAFLAAVGLSAVIWILADAVFSRREKTIHASILLPLSGTADEMETSAAAAHRALRQLRSDGMVLLVDCGLAEEGLRRAGFLARDMDGVKLIYPEEIGEELQ